MQNYMTLHYYNFIVPHSPSLLSVQVKILTLPLLEMLLSKSQGSLMAKVQDKAPLLHRAK